MSVASPDLLKTVTFVDVTPEDIGGAELHAKVTGSCDVLVNSDEEALSKCRELMGYLPSNWREKAPSVVSGDDPNRCEDRLLSIPGDSGKGYDVHDIISLIVDNQEFYEIQSLFAPSIVIGFARLDGQSVGIVANNPAVNYGSLNADACDKSAHFIRTCDAFNIPLIFMVDSPGFRPDREQEHSQEGLPRHAAKPVYAICESTISKVTVYLGKCYGAARLVMGTRMMGVDAVYAWPNAEVRSADIGTLAHKIYRKEIAEQANPNEYLKEKIEALNSMYPEPYHSGAILSIDDIIDPTTTRPVLIKALRRMSDKRVEEGSARKHSLIPL